MPSGIFAKLRYCLVAAITECWTKLHSCCICAGRKWVKPFSMQPVWAGPITVACLSLKGQKFELVMVKSSEGKNNLILCSLSVTGGTLAITGTYLLVTFAPHSSVHITAHLVRYYMLSWQFLLYLVSIALKDPFVPPMMRYLSCVCIQLLSCCSSRPLISSSFTTVNYSVTFLIHQWKRGLWLAWPLKLKMM